MRKALRFVVIVACLSVMATAPVYAKGYGCSEIYAERFGKEDKAGLEDKFYQKAGFILSNASELGLSDAQADKVRALKHRVKRSLVVRDAQIEALALDVAEALRQEDADITAVDDLISKKYEAKKQKAQEVAAAYIELKGILSKDQMKILKGTWSEKMGASYGEKVCPRCKMMQKHESTEKRQKK